MSKDGSGRVSSAALWRRRRFPWVLPMVAMLASGCRDQAPAGPTDAEGARSGVSALIADGDPGPPEDPGLTGTGDTYATAIVETQSHEVVYADQAVVNPATMGVSNTFESQSSLALYRYEVGYDQNGNQVAAQRYTAGDTADGGSADEAIHLSLAGSVVTERNAAGTVVQPEESPEKMVTDEFAAGLGDLNGVPPLVNGFEQGVSQSFLTRGSASAQRLMQASASAVPLPPIPAGVTVLDLGGSRVEATQRARVRGGTRIHRAEYAVTRGAWRLQKWNTLERYDGAVRRGYRETTGTVKALRVQHNVTRDAMRLNVQRLTIGSDAIMYAAPMVPRPLLEIPEEPPYEPPPPPATCQFGATRGGVTGPRVALQHGILSDACTWTGGYPANLFARAVNVRALRATETTASQRYNDQASTLHGQTQQLQAGAYVVSGHSNGGIVGRMAARTYGTGVVSGVVSLGSPHAGAPIVTLNRQVAVLAGTVAQSTALFQTVTFVFGQPIGLVGLGIAKWKAGPGLLFVAGGVGTLMLQESQDVFEQMRPGASAAGGLNTVTEPTYTKIALFSETPQKWISARIACDQFGGGGAGCVKKMQRAARWAFFTSIVGTIAGAAGFTPGFAIAQFAGGWLARMWAIDKMYQWLVSSGAASDGVVPATSQRAFPNLTLPARRIIGDPTHLMMTKTQTGRNELENGLRFNGAVINGSPPGS